MCPSVRGTRFELEFALAALAHLAPDFAATSHTKRFFDAEVAIWTPIWQFWGTPKHLQNRPQGSLNGDFWHT